MARDTEVPHGTLHLGSPTGPDVSRDEQAMSVRDVIKHARANATAAKAASKLSSATQPTRPSLYDLHSSSTEPKKPIPPLARNRSPSFPRSSVLPQTPTNQQDDSGVTHSRSKEPKRISPPDAIGKRGRGGGRRQTRTAAARGGYGDTGGSGKE